MSTIRALRLTALTLAALIPAAGSAQGVPNLSGTWVLAPERSDFGGGPPSGARTDVIDHREPKLIIHRTVTGDGGEVKAVLTFGIDGKPYKNSIAGQEVTATLKWDAATLVMESSLTGPNGTFGITDRYSLSADGATMTMARTIDAQGQQVVQKLVFTRT
jgi:hypothetical protein